MNVTEEKGETGKGFNKFGTFVLCLPGKQPAVIFRFKQLNDQIT